MTATLPVAKIASAHTHATSAFQLLRRRKNLIKVRMQSQNRLDSRGGRIDTTGGTIKERRFRRIFSQRHSHHLVQALVVVKARRAIQYQHFARGRLHRHHRATAAHQGLASATLQVQANSSVQIHTQFSRAAVQLFVHTAMGVNLNIAIARTAMEQIFVLRLQSSLANEAMPGIQLLVNPAPVIRRDTSHMTKHRRRM